MSRIIPFEIDGHLGLKKENLGASVGGTDGWIDTSGGPLTSYTPIDGSALASIRQAGVAEYEKVMEQACRAFVKWRMTPAPERGQVVREIGDALRAHKEELGALVTLEMGKIKTEGQGEVQEMIDMADFSVGLSRQLYGLTMQSERPHHRLYEQWHPLGPIGVITAFNFPVAVWSWNALLAAVCGDVIIWKPSSKSALTAIGVMNVIAPVLDKYDLRGVFNLVIGKGSDIGDRLINDRRLPLISATGSCAMGRRVGQAVAARLGRSLLELGGNNAVVVSKSADQDMALRAVLFGAVGTAGQRCTSTRRLIIDQAVADAFIGRLTAAYGRIVIGNPFDDGVLMGPLVDQSAVDQMMNALAQAKKEGAEILFGGKTVQPAGLKGGYYVEPTIVKAPANLPTMREETFAPILYVVTYKNFDEAIEIHNSVDQGLSSSLFTGSLYDSEQFLSHRGSDCGIANVNVGTSGAEIGGAFGGEKDTGGGRESGSDAWKIYMRRQTNTINWGKTMPLAQGVKFDLD